MKNYDVYSYNDGDFEKEEHNEKEVDLTWGQILLSPNCLILMLGFIFLAPIMIFVLIFRGGGK